MAHKFQIAYKLQTSPPLPANTKISISSSPFPLMNEGFNMPVSVSISSSIKLANPDQEFKTVTVMAHFDTGASRTNIDIGLAEYMGLIPTGMGSSSTANGSATTPNYAVDISFPNSNLSPFINLPIRSCQLPFALGPNGEAVIKPGNFGILLGRDIMARWNIVWNGPTSTVFISD